MQPLKLTAMALNPDSVVVGRPKSRSPLAVGLSQIPRLGRPKSKSPPAAGTSQVPPIGRQKSQSPPAAGTSQVPRLGRRLLPPFFSERKPPISQPSSQGSEEEDSDLKTLTLAKEYLEKRIEGAKAAREQRYDMFAESPEGSQDSVQVSYSQGSNISGEFPVLENVIDILLCTFTEERLQQLFNFTNIDSDVLRLKIVRPLVDCDLDFLCKLVVEAIGCLGAPAEDDEEPVVSGLGLRITGSPTLGMGHAIL